MSLSLKIDDWVTWMREERQRFKEEVKHKLKNVFYSVIFISYKLKEKEGRQKGWGKSRAHMILITLVDYEIWVESIYSLIDQILLYVIMKTNIQKRVILRNIKFPH